MTKNSSPSRAPKTGAQLRDNPEEREKCGKTAKNSLQRRHNPLLKAECPPLLRTGMSTDSGDELNLWHFHCRNRRCMITGTSTTVDELCQSSTSRNCGISTISSQLRTNLQDLHNKHRSPCQCTATGESPWFSTGPKRLPLRHDRDVDDLRNWNVLRRREELNLRHLVAAYTGTSTTAGTAPATPSCTCRRNNGHVTTLSKNWTNARDNQHTRDIDHHVKEEQQETQHKRSQLRPAPPPPQPHHHHTSPPSEPIGLPRSRPLNSSQPVPPPRARTMALRGAPSPC